MKITQEQYEKMISDKGDSVDLNKNLHRDKSLRNTLKQKLAAIKGIKPTDSKPTTTTDHKKDAVAAIANAPAVEPTVEPTVEMEQTTPYKVPVNYEVTYSRGTHDAPVSVTPDESDDLDSDNEANDDESNGDDVIQLVKPDVTKKPKLHNKKLFIIIGVIAVAVVIIGLAVMAIVSKGHNTTTNNKASEATSTSIKTNSKLTSAIVIKTEDDVKMKLTATAKATKQPFKLQTQPIGGGYVLGIITYFPDDTNTYMDYSITAPQTPGNVIGDDRAKQIETKLTASLNGDNPTINKTIKVKDASKVSMRTYKGDKNYTTVLLYDNKPFGFTSTDKDDNMVNTVTTYYIDSVEKH